MAPNYAQNTAKSCQICTTVNLPFKRPLHAGYMEGDSITLGNAAHIAIPVLNALLPKLKSFAPGDVRSAKPMVEQRHGMLLCTPVLIAYLMHHRYRGRLLSNEERATALKSIESACKQLSVAVAPLDEVLAFVAQTSSFAETHAFVCHPFHFWNALHASSPAAALGKVVARLPAKPRRSECLA